MPKGFARKESAVERLHFIYLLAQISPETLPQNQYIKQMIKNNFTSYIEDAKI
jgi:hypothetical protein